MLLRSAVFRHLADDEQELVFAEDVLVLLEQFVVDRHLDHARLVVQRHDQDLAALRESLMYELRGAEPSWLHVDPPPPEPDLDFDALFDDDEVVEEPATQKFPFFLDDDDAEEEEPYVPTYAYFRFYWS